MGFPLLSRKCNIVLLSGHMSSEPVDVKKLAGMLKAKRGRLGLRAVADEISGVSASTLSRVEQGNVPDLDTFFRLCQWLGVSADEFASSHSLGKRGSPLNSVEFIEAHFRAERVLPDQAIEALSQMVQFAYAAASKKTGNSTPDN